MMLSAAVYETWNTLVPTGHYSYSYKEKGPGQFSSNYRDCDILLSSIDSVYPEITTHDSSPGAILCGCVGPPGCCRCTNFETCH